MSQAIQPVATDLPRLLAELRAWGITYLTSAPPDTKLSPLSPMELLAALAQIAEPRVRDATIALLLLHPDLAPDVGRVVETARNQFRDAIAEQEITLMLAALYLQRMWSWRLTRTIPGRVVLAETPFAAYWRARHLPNPARDFGVPGLRQLAAYERQRTGGMADYAGDWLNQMRHLLHQEWTRRQSGEAPATHDASSQEDATILAAAGEQVDLESDDMSLRPDVSRDQIEQFLREFGQLVHHPGRVYLVGGAALIHHNVRGPGATTVDIDLRLVVDDEQEAEAAIRQLIARLGINVELAYPGDFMPLPADWEARSPYVGRYGPLDVFYFDFVSSALAKIERGTDRDLRDVDLMAQQGLVRRDELAAAAQQILPQLGHGRFFNVDPQRFAQQLADAIARVWGTPP